MTLDSHKDKATEPNQIENLDTEEVRETSETTTEEKRNEEGLAPDGKADESPEASESEEAVEPASEEPSERQGEIMPEEATQEETPPEAMAEEPETEAESGESLIDETASSQEPADAVEAASEDQPAEADVEAPPEDSVEESVPESPVAETEEVAAGELTSEPLPDAEEPASDESETPPAEAVPETAAVAEPATDREKPVEKKARATKTKADDLPVLPEEQTADKRWYVIHAHSGHENKVRQSLENRVKQEGLQDLVNQVLVPTEEVAEVKGGKKRITARKIFPGYVLMEMKLTNKTWYLIRTTPGVTGFIGSGKMPTPLEPDEIESIFEQMRGEHKKPKPKVEFEKDERVKIIEGPFSNFMGTVDEVNPERGKLKVLVEIFERLTSVELEFWQVEKT